jgi:two-component system, sensor histidine kinase and response regulator
MDEDKSKEIKVLIVDDNSTNINVLCKTLEPKGYSIQIAPNGETALKILNKSPSPDLILLDIMMPGIDGYETCRRIKADKLTSDIPVIFLTAKNETEDIVKGFEVGGVDYITKPFQQDEVYARIETHINLESLKKKLIENNLELETKNRELEELNGLKNKFIGMASHDLRNPLSSILGFSEMLKEDIDFLPKEERDEYLDILCTVSDQMLNMVNELLNVSVIESGKLQLKYINSSLKRLVETRVRLYEAPAGKKNITLKSDLADIPDFEFDPNRIGQVLDNLITNAIKFSPEGKPVYITLKVEGKLCEVNVRDEGPGISQEDQGKMFQHFQRLSTKPTGGESSTGLGLAIAKKMVDAHNGILGVKSSLGNGSKFFLQIPMEMKN